jgi:hypothetical protein
MVNNPLGLYFVSQGCPFSVTERFACLELLHSIMESEA